MRSNATVTVTVTASALAAGIDALRQSGARREAAELADALAEANREGKTVAA